MKLCIVTQVVDKQHPVLGFFHEWLREFAKHVDSLEVIALSVGEHDLPENVSVHSLGKEQGGVGRVVYLWRFFRYISSLSYDHVFVHMNQIYVILGWEWWKFFGKKIGLWYVHREVSMSLRIASMFVDTVFTTAPESFRVKSKKVRYMGHGIVPISVKGSLYTGGTLSLISIGRISPVKRVELVASVSKELSASCVVVGGPGTEDDEAYFVDLVEQFEDVSFTGPLPHAEALSYLSNAHIFVHTSKTGSTDKVVLEALLAGVPVVSTSEAFRDMLSPYGLFSEDDSVEGIVLVVRAYMEKPYDERKRDSEAFMQEVKDKHSLSSLIQRIVRAYE